MAKKYRPYFTLSELRILSATCKNVPLKRYLDKFIRDVDDGYISTSLEVTDTLEVRLGISPKEDKTVFEVEQNRRYLADEMSPEEEKSYELSQGVK